MTFRKVSESRMPRTLQTQNKAAPDTKRRTKILHEPRQKTAPGTGVTTRGAARLIELQRDVHYATQTFRPKLSIRTGPFAAFPIYALQTSPCERTTVKRENQTVREILLVDRTDFVQRFYISTATFLENQFAQKFTFIPPPSEYSGTN